MLAGKCLRPAWQWRRYLGSATAFPAGSRPQGIVSGNFNAGVVSDLATANINSNNVSILLGTGTGSFGPATNFSATTPLGIVTADFNNDGNLDLAVPDFAGATVINPYPIALHAIFRRYQWYGLRIGPNGAG